MTAVGNDPERLLKRLPLESRLSRAARAPLPAAPAAPASAPGTWPSACSARAAPAWPRSSGPCASCASCRPRYRLGDDCTVSGAARSPRQHGNLRTCLWEPLCLAALNTAPNRLRRRFSSIRCATVSAVIARRPTCCCRQPTSTSCSRPQRRASSRRTAGKSACRRGWRAIDASFVVAVSVSTAWFSPSARSRRRLARRERAKRPVTALLADYRWEPIGTVYCGYPPEVRLPLPMLGLAAQGRGRVRAVGLRSRHAVRHGGSDRLRAQRQRRLGGALRQSHRRCTLVAALHDELAAALGTRLVRRSSGSR
jgi:hypothetical protein